MLRLISKRLALLPVMVLGVVTVAFVLLQLAPGDPVTALLGDFPADPEYIAERRAQMGLDRPLIVQYVNYVTSVLRGDLGYSFANRTDVTPYLLQALQNTLILVVAAMLIAIVLGILLGALAGTTNRRGVDTGINVGAIAAFCVPRFWLGQIALLVFALGLGWFPVQGMRTIGGTAIGVPGVMDLLDHLVLPAIVLAVPEIAVFARITRTSMREVTGKGYVLTARSKGLPERDVTRRHVLRNALLPTTTVVGYTFGYLLAGSVLVESVFGWPGMGTVLFDAIARRDNSVVLGALVIVGTATLLVNLLTDVTYGIIDPRIRTGEMA